MKAKKKKLSKKMEKSKKDKYVKLIDRIKKERDGVNKWE